MSAGITVKAPSNIAFLKYWGKRDAALQWPANDSLSMTLSALGTVTHARLHEGAEHRFHYAGDWLPRDHKSFGKIYKHLDFLAKDGGFAAKLWIDSRNSFPTGAGIASSASGLAALTLAAICAWTKSSSWDELSAHGYTRQRLAHLARLGSGSAGRSLFGGYIQWHAGETADAQAVEAVWPAEHWALCDSVVLFAHGEKSKSSSQAHGDAWSSPLFAARVAGAPERLQRMKEAIAAKSLKQLGPLLEAEALEMHAVMMTTEPPQNYLTPESTEFLAAFRRARQRGLFEAYFTIDAGPNIHIIHESSEALLNWLDREYPQYQRLDDRVGQGPELEAISL